MFPREVVPGEEPPVQVPMLECDFLAGASVAREKFSWKGDEPLACRMGTPIVWPQGFVPACILKISPPAAIKELALQPDWLVYALTVVFLTGVESLCRCIISIRVEYE